MSFTSLDFESIQLNYNISSILRRFEISEIKWKYMSSRNNEIWSQEKILCMELSLILYLTLLDISLNFKLSLFLLSLVQSNCLHKVSWVDAEWILSITPQKYTLPHAHTQRESQKSYHWSHNYIINSVSVVVFLWNII